MDQTQQKALNALESYILLSKSATSPRAAADLVTQATSALNTYVFAELLQTPNIQSLRTASAEYAPYLTLLEIFSWGTWSDYTSTPDLPQLSDIQSHKLRQLSLLTLSTSHATLTYSHLLSVLALPNVRVLEDLVISSIYAGLLTAKLDTLSKRVDVSSVSPLRDLRPNSVPQMVAVLDDWNNRCVGVLAEIEGQVREVRRKATERRKREQEHEKIVERAINDDGLKEKGRPAAKRGAGDTENGGGYDADGGDAMDVDDTLARGGARNAKRGGMRFSGFGKRLGG
ncbi:hypothetical protein MMC24_001482 [Lignoscripta atroalba]|nr:hypothetical protein [Lignoscripta atroalba]